MPVVLEKWIELGPGDILLLMDRFRENDDPGELARCEADTLPEALSIDQVKDSLRRLGVDAALVCKRMGMVDPARGKMVALLHHAVLLANEQAQGGGEEARGDNSDEPPTKKLKPALKTAVQVCLQVAAECAVDFTRWIGV